MIQRHTDHAANERTDPAWIRTAITVMAFGFPVEKFDRFLRPAADQAAPGGALPPPPSAAPDVGGPGLFGVGALIVVTAMLHFFVHRAAVEADRPVPYGMRRTDLPLSILLLGIALVLLFCLAHRLSG